MAYSVYGDIEADFKDITFSTTSNVKIADVTQFIVEADALIDAYVGTVYTVPVVTAGAGLSLLKLLSRSLVTARIRKILEVKQEKSDEANQNVVGVLLGPSACMKILADIQAKKLKLEGATVLSSGLGFYSSNNHCDVEPVIKKNTRQW